MSMRVMAELEKNRVICQFPYDRDMVFKIKQIPGARFVPADKGGPAWSFPLELAALRDLRKAFGRMFIPSPELLEWGKAKAMKATALKSLSNSDSAELTVIKHSNPRLWEAIHLGPRGKDMEPELRAEKLADPMGSYQCADVAFMAHSNGPLNALHPGLGKTIETIASVFESGMEKGPHLVIAPLTSLETVWVKELSLWQDYPALVTLGGKQDREWVMEDAQMLLDSGKPFWLVVNHAMVRQRETKVFNKKLGEYEIKVEPLYPFLHNTEWNTVILDEAHKSGVQNVTTQTSKGLHGLKAQKRIAITGTPIGGSPIKLFGLLSWLSPREFTSKWRWAEQWLHVTSNGFGKTIGGVRKEKEEQFYEHIAPYMIRRTKAEVLKDLPPKQYVELWAEMDGKQLAQYRAMAEESEAKIAGMEEEGKNASIIATCVLAEYTRLKQFASAECTFGKYINADTETREVVPTTNSCKLPVLMDLLEERGILEDEGDEQVVIFSQFSKMVDMIHRHLTEQGIKALKLTGATNAPGQRTDIQNEFQSDDQDRARVLCVTTTAGGVAITLDRASTVVFFDETWVPDDQEQAEDRCHRASRIHQVTVYYIRSKGSIEENIQNRVGRKDLVNRKILDLRRAGYNSLEVGDTKDLSRFETESEKAEREDDEEE